MDPRGLRSPAATRWQMRRTALREQTSVPDRSDRRAPGDDPGDTCCATDRPASLHDEDPLAPARGILVATLLGSLTWALAISAAIAACRVR